MEALYQIFCWVQDKICVYISLIYSSAAHLPCGFQESAKVFTCEIPIISHAKYSHDTRNLRISQLQSYVHFVNIVVGLVFLFLSYLPCFLKIWRKLFNSNIGFIINHSHIISAYMLFFNLIKKIAIFHSSLGWAWSNVKTNSLGFFF